ncbi:MAG: helix-turn-helix domain-containing protein, partial [Myxococcales bacterium]|nr:helix-turn-helix domain-containing protein [Myxococcales bacterium]
PASIYRRDGLSLPAKLVYGYLAMRQGRSSKAWPSVAAIAEDLDIDRKTAMRAAGDLEQLRRVLESAGSVGSTYAGALSDGHLTAREREQLAALAREAVSVLLGVVHVMAPTPPTPIREVR